MARRGARFGVAGEDLAPELDRGAPAELWRANVGLGYSQAIVRGDWLYTMG